MFRASGCTAHSKPPTWLQLQKYQEQRHLLDPLLEELVTPLAAQLRRLAAQGPAASLPSVQSVSCLLWALVTVRCAPRLLFPDNSFCICNIKIPSTQDMVQPIPSFLCVSRASRVATAEGDSWFK